MEIKSIIFSIIFLEICGFGFGYLESVAANAIMTPETSDAQEIQQGEFLPMVAFQCGYRNRFFARNGTWITDQDSNAGCLEGKLDILKYCKKVYPNFRINNIVESNQNLDLENWCKVDGQQPCKWTLNVRPYRCLVGKFESEALLVPEHCHFGHVDDQNTCASYDAWNKTARQECRKQHPQEEFVVKSFAMLEPCGLDLFSGVEFVCCPKSEVNSDRSNRGDGPTIDLKVKVKLGDSEQAVTSPKPRTTDGDSDDSSDEADNDDEEDDDDDDSVEEIDASATKKPIENQSIVKKRVLTTTSAPTTAAPTTGNRNDGSSEDDDGTETAATEDPYFRTVDPDREYKIYRAALERLERKHREKVAEALRKLNDAESKYEKSGVHNETRIEEMKAVFQKTMFSLSQQHHDDRHRIDETHEQRVTVILNERKRESIKNYRESLSQVATSQSTPHSEKSEKQRRQLIQKIMKNLENYIRLEEKERIHILNRYRYFVRTDLEEAAEIKNSLIKRLRDIDLRINGTIEMMRDFSNLMDKIKPAILEFWQAFRDENTPGKVDDGLTWIGDSTNSERILDFYKLHYETKFRKEQEEDERKMNQASSTVTSSEKSSTETTESDIRAPIPKSDSIIKLKEMIEHEDISKAHAFSLKESFQHAAAMKEETVSHDHHHYGYVILTVAAATVLVAMILGFLIYKRRSSRMNGFIAVDASSPEERQISTMQFNGYENPTYTYFENGKAA